MAETIKSKIKRDLRQIEKFGIKVSPDEHLFSKDIYLTNKDGKITSSIHLFFCEMVNNYVNVPAYVSYSIISWNNDDYTKIEFKVNFEHGKLEGGLKRLIEKIKKCPLDIANTLIEEYNHMLGK